MADVKISALSAIASVAGEDLFAIIDDPSGTPASRKATCTQLATFLNSTAATISAVKTYSAAPVFNDAVKVSLGTGSDSTLVDTGAVAIFDFDEQNVGSRSFDIQSDATSIALFNDTIITFSVPIDVPDVETATVSARDGTLAITVADSTGVCTFNGAIASPTLTTPNIGTPSAGTIDADNVTISNCAIGAEVTTVLAETEEMWIPAGAFISATTNGAEITSRETTTNVVNYTYAGFDTTTSEIIWFTWTPPLNWDAGTMKAVLHWTNTAGLTTETIDFDLAAVALANDNPLDTAVGTAVSITDTWIAQNDLHISAQSAALTVAGTPVAGEEIHFKLSRDVASDDMTGDVDIIGIVLEFGIDDIGTT